jgi:hypothetical protein
MFLMQFRELRQSFLCSRLHRFQFEAYPPGILTFSFLSVKPFLTSTEATAHDELPEARVQPAPRSQINTSTSVGEITFANCTLIRFGNIG